MQEVPGSNLGRQIGVLIQVYRGFPQSLHENNGIMPQNRPQPLHISKIYYLAIQHYIKCEVGIEIDQGTRQKRKITEESKVVPVLSFN
jgi:hypothetical protein